MGACRKEDFPKVALFLIVAGPEALDVFNSVQLIQAEEANYETVQQECEVYCTSCKNETYARDVFPFGLLSAITCPNSHGSKILPFPTVSDQKIKPSAISHKPDHSDAYIFDSWT